MLNKDVMGLTENRHQYNIGYVQNHTSDQSDESDPFKSVQN